MALNSVQKEWERFSDMVFQGLGMGPSHTQYEEMKKAFFAGAWSMFTAMEEMGQPHVLAEEAEQFLLERRGEMLTFKNTILAQYANKN